MNNFLVKEALIAAKDLLSDEYQSLLDDDLKIEYQQTIDKINEALASIDEPKP
jgi:hypothetical protein